MRARPGHRSSPATLRRLVVAEMYWHAGRPRADVLGRLSPGAVGDRVQALLARRGGGDRRSALEACRRNAERALAVRSLRGFSPGERRAWERWAPIVVLAGRVDRWTAAERRGAVRVIRAKGARRESEFVARFDRHTRLRAAVGRLARRRG
jgi:hypothetical protein